MRALALTACLALALAACLRPYPEMLGEDLPPDAGPPPADTELTRFVPIPDATADLTYLAVATNEIYASDGKTLWMRHLQDAPQRLDLSGVLGGATVEAIGGLWGSLTAGMGAEAIVLAKAGGSWHLVLVWGYAKWSRDFPGNSGPSALASTLYGALATDGTQAILMSGNDGKGDTFPLPAGLPPPTLGMTASAFQALFFLPADGVHPPGMIASDGRTMGTPVYLQEQAGTKLTEAQCATVTGLTGTNNGVVLSAIYATEGGTWARFTGNETGGTWAPVPDFGLEGRCLTASTYASGEAYADPHGLVLQDQATWKRRAYVGVEATAAAPASNPKDGIVLAAKRTDNGQRGLTTSVP